jgi:glutathione S-transferase
MSTMSESAEVILFGRSSSHFTRVTRIFASELGVPYAFRPVPNLMSLDESEYGGNPALKVPVLQVGGEAWFGAATICRVLARLSPAQRRVVWPEAANVALVANAQELTLQAMSTEVTLVMSQLGDAGAGSAHAIKLRRSLVDSLLWLDRNVASALAALPADRDLSFLEVTLYCLITHLAFRDIAPVEPYPALCAFRSRFAERPSAVQTAYRFDT